MLRACLSLPSTPKWRWLSISVGQQASHRAAAVRFLSPGFGTLPGIPLQESDFNGEKGQIFVHTAGESQEYYRTILVGLGDKVTEKALASATHAAVTKLKALKQPAADVLLPGPNNLPRENAARIISTVACLSDYAFDQFITKPNGKLRRLDKLHLVASPDMAPPQCEQVRQVTEHAVIVGNAVNYARDLGNTRADVGTPSYYEQQAAQLCASHAALSMKVLQFNDLQREGMQLFSAVGQGATEKPRLVILEYKGVALNEGSTPPLALVGKGLTFDSGGLNLKPTGSIETMHMDMHGSATVLGVMKAIAELQLPCHVVAALALAENAIGPESYKPSAIIPSLKGLTVEIGNTDAEGRLVLADTLTYIQRNYQPKKVLDFATLTGAIIIALGERICGYFCNDDELATQLTAASLRAGEKCWRMPLDEDYYEDIKGDTSDLRNTGKGRAAGSCTAAAFLQQFIEDGVQWAHFDIAGTGMASAARGHHPKGATGFGVQTIVDFIQHEALGKR